MKKLPLLLSMSCLFFWIPLQSYGQQNNELEVEESAEVFLEEYSDAFQENFFEGLKQKGIQNYDRAINFLLECKRLQPKNEAVMHELAKLYYLDKKYGESILYGVEAVSKKPQNYWYLYTLVSSLNAQGSTIAKVENDIPIKDNDLKENLAGIYFGQEKYENALALLKSLEPSKSIAVLEQNIKHAIVKKEEKTTSVSFSGTVNNNRGTGTLDSYKSRIRGLLMMASGNSLLLQVSGEALETFPAQPYFYYANGYALNRCNKHRAAIEVLETALDYMLSDISLANKIYSELATAYNAISNPSKANMYLRKVKPGF